MELACLHIGKQVILSQKVQYSPHGFYVIPALILSIDEDVIQIHNNKDIKLFCQDYIDITLEAGRNVR